jgi:DNA-binding CsgD family transcriptional regulator
MTRYDRAARDIVALAASGAAAELVWREALELLQRAVGLDSAAVVPRASGLPFTQGKDRTFTARFAERKTLYAMDLAPVARAARRARGVAVDTSVLSTRDLDRLPMYAEIVRPQGIRSSMYTYLSVGDRFGSVISIARHDRHTRRFADRDAERVRRLVPFLTACDSMLGGIEDRASAEVAPWPALSAREEEIVRYVCNGLRNAEIAALCGISPHTVRNQLASVFRKVNVTTRAELVAMALSRSFTGL